jgi:hypothetical protein
MRRISLCILILVASISLAQFNPGDSVRVILTTDCVNARSAPSLKATILRCEPAGGGGVIISGPVVGDGTAFYNIEYADGLIAWSAGKYLEIAHIAPPPPPPSGSLSVSRVIDGFATAWYTTFDDTAAVLSGHKQSGTISGTVVFPATQDVTLSLTLSGPGGTRTYTASTANGSNIPPTLDSARVAQAAYAQGFLDGKASIVCPPVDSVAVSIRNALAPWLK